MFHVAEVHGPEGSFLISGHHDQPRCFARRSEKSPCLPISELSELPETILSVIKPVVARITGRPV
jgi:hypothetical protein